MELNSSFHGDVYALGICNVFEANFGVNFKKLKIGH